MRWKDQCLSVIYHRLKCHVRIIFCQRYLMTTFSCTCFTLYSLLIIIKNVGCYWARTKINVRNFCNMWVLIRVSVSENKSKFVPPVTPVNRHFGYHKLNSIIYILTAKFWTSGNMATLVSKHCVKNFIVCWKIRNVFDSNFCLSQKWNQYFKVWKWKEFLILKCTKNFKTFFFKSHIISKSHTHNHNNTTPNYPTNPITQ